MRITAEQKLELAQLVKERKLSILDFTSIDNISQFTVKYKYDYFSFAIERSRSDEYKMTVFPIDNTKGFTVGGKWNDVTNYFNSWLAGVEQEVNTVTGWETPENSNTFYSSYEDLNEPYSSAEKTQELKNLNEFRTRLLDIGLEKEKEEIIIQALNRLESKIDSLSKFDWRSQLVGALIGLIITLSVPPEFAGMIWFQFRTAFRNYALGF